MKEKIINVMHLPGTPNAFFLEFSKEGKYFLTLKQWHYLRKKLFTKDLFQCTKVFYKF